MIYRLYNKNWAGPAMMMEPAGQSSRKKRRGRREVDGRKKKMSAGEIRKEVRKQTGTKREGGKVVEEARRDVEVMEMDE